MRNVIAFPAVLFVIMASCSFAFAANDKSDKNDKKSEMQLAVDFSHAGISLAVPTKFEFMPVNDRYGIMMAMLFEYKEPKVSVLLTAFPVAKETTAETYAKGMYEDLEGNLGITKLSLRKKITMKVAGIDSVVQLLQYTFRASETHSARVFFVREQADPAVRVCYILEIQASPASKNLLVPTLRKVTNSVKMVPFVRPHSLPITQMIGPICNYRSRYCMSVPYGWQVVRDDKGNMTGLSQNDYLGGNGVFMAVSIDEMETTEAPDKYAKKALEVVQKAGGERGITFEILSEGPTEMGGLKAYQQILRKKVKATEKTPESLKLIIRRIICVPPLEEGLKPRAYTMHVEMPDTDPKLPSAMMDKLAGGFSLLDEEGMPVKRKTATTEPDATTKPAATQPADKKKDEEK